MLVALLVGLCVRQGEIWLVPAQVAGNIFRKVVSDVVEGKSAFPRQI